MNGRPFGSWGRYSGITLGIEQALSEAVSFDHHFITFDSGFHTHLGQHIKNGLSSVTFLIGKTADSCKAACALAECCKYRYYREEVRAVRSIYAECLERGSLYCDVSSVSIQLRKTCSCIHQDVHYREVGLKGCRIQSFELDLSEDRSCNQEGCSRAPVTFKVYVGSLVFLTAFDLEHHFSAEGPVSSGLYEVLTAKHIVADLYAELLEDFEGNECIWDTLWFMYYERAVAVRERQGHEQT